MRTALQRNFQRASKAVLYLYLTANSCPSQIFLPMGLGVIPGGSRGSGGSERPVAAGHGCITLPPGHYWASIAVVLLIPVLPPQTTHFLRGVTMGEAILRHSKWSSLGLAHSRCSTPPDFMEPVCTSLLVRLDSSQGTGTFSALVTPSLSTICP